MTKKILAPLSAVAFMALVAVSLIAAGGTATAAVNGLSQSATTVTSAGTVVLTVDAGNASGDITFATTTGTFTACTDAPADATAGTPDVCALTSGALATANIVVNDGAADNAGGNVDTLSVTWTAPTTTTPQTAQITVVQGSSTKVVTVKVRGSADAVAFTILNGASTSTSVCQGTEAHVVRSTTATFGLVAGTLCSVVTDSAGNRLPAQTVIYTRTDGTVTGTTDTTGASGQRATTSTIAAGTTGASGDEATVTAASAGKTATDTIKFGGDPSSCSITTNPTSVSVGGSATIMVAVMDSTGGPVPDDGGGAVGVATNSSVAVQQVNSGQGANAAILNANPAIVNGTASATAIAAIQGAIALGVASNTTGNTTSCTGTLSATGQVTPPVGGGTTGDGSLSAPTFGTGDVGSAVFAGGTIEQLSAAVTASGGTAVWVQGTDGNWYRYNALATGATAFVNNAFNAQFSAGLSQSAVFVVK